MEFFFLISFPGFSLLVSLKKFSYSSIWTIVQNLKSIKEYTVESLFRPHPLAARPLPWRVLAALESFPSSACVQSMYKQTCMCALFLHWVDSSKWAIRPIHLKNCSAFIKKKSFLKKWGVNKLTSFYPLLCWFSGGQEFTSFFEFLEEVKKKAVKMIFPNVPSWHFQLAQQFEHCFV